MTLEIVNFGCRLNIAEGEAIRAAAAGLTGTTVINSCAVTNEAVRQGRQAVRRATRSGRRVIVTGCAAQLEPERFAAMPGVSAVLGNREKRTVSAYEAICKNPLLPSEVEGLVRAQRELSSRGLGFARQSPSTSLGRNGMWVGEIFGRNGGLSSPVVSGPSHARAFVEVQTGCDHRCTFCIIPFARGNAASAPPEAVVAAIRAAVARGQREAVLTGVDLTGYAGGLAPLVARILHDVPELPRLRLSSLDPCEIDDALIGLFADEERLMPHAHLSLQAGDDLILKRMKRRHSRNQAVEIVARLKAARPGIAIGADLIAGFPTEDEAMFASSLALIDDCDIVHGHVFPYSPRAGTPAARMPQVPVAVARERAARLREAVAARRAAWLAGLRDTEQDILVERDGVSGHAPNFARATVSPSTPGSIVRLRVAAGMLT